MSGVVPSFLSHVPVGARLSNPFLRLVLQRIRERGGWTPILERIAAGEALTHIAKDYGCSRWSFYKLLHKKDQLWDLFLEARRQSAMALAEEGTDILDELSEPAPDGGIRVVTREDIALARERVAQRRWLAQAYDRETFGIQTPEGGQHLSIGSLHLRVLMAPQQKTLAPAQQNVLVPVEADIVSEEPAHEADA